MERRFRVRLDELLNDAEVPRSLLRGVLPRLETFLQPFVGALRSPEQQSNAQQYVQGLLSDLKSKDAESIAYLHDRERQGIQKFIGQAEWDHRPMLDELTRQLASELGEPDAVLVFDPSAFAKKGSESVGVARQWCGRLGKLENCQLGVYLGYVSRREHTLVDFRLYLPKEWATDRKRRKKAGVPRQARFRTRHELALEMLDERGKQLPHAWVAGDDEMGRSSWFRQQLRLRNEHYALAVPGNTLVRDLTAKESAYRGHGRRPQVPLVRADVWCSGLPESAWQRLEVRDAEKGPLLTQAAWTLVQAKTQGKVSEAVEALVVFRERQGDGSWKHDYTLADAIPSEPLKEFARVCKAEHRIEECIKRAKGEAGLADYQVRSWEGWHHHQALSILATWFLVKETRRGKNTDSGADTATGSAVAGGVAKPTPQQPHAHTPPSHHESPFATQRASTPVPLALPQPLGATTF